MDVQTLEKVEKAQIKKISNFQVGDTIEVHTVIKEGEKTRTQVFKGLVIAIKGSGLRKTFTVRKISHGVGVEKIFPINSPNIEKIKVVKKGKVRRSKLYYMRKRVGKEALKVGEGLWVDEETIEELKETVDTEGKQKEAEEAEKEEEKGTKKEGEEEKAKKEEKPKEKVNKQSKEEGKKEPKKAKEEKTKKDSEKDEEKKDSSK